MKSGYSLRKCLKALGVSDVGQRMTIILSNLKMPGKMLVTGLLLFHAVSASLSQEMPALLSVFDSCHVQPSEQIIAPFAIQVATSPVVRVAYVIPSNRSPQPNGVAYIQNALKAGQEWYGDQMEQNGFGTKTFMMETQPDGVTPLVHVVNVNETDEYLRGDIWGRTIQAAMNAGLSVWASGEVWVLIPEAHMMLADGTLIGGAAFGGGNGSGSSGGVAMISGYALPLYQPGMISNDTPYDGQVLPAIGSFPMKQDVTFAWFEGTTFSSIASSWLGALWHEMGHAFGLAHDFRNDNNFHGNLMGNGLRGTRGYLFPERYPRDYTRLEFCSASILNVSHYFNRDKRNTLAPVISYIDPGSVIPEQGHVRIKVRASDSDLLYLADLRYQGNTVSEIPLQGKSADITFSVPYFTKGASNSYTIAVHDYQGITTYSDINLNVQDGYNQAPIPFIRIDPPVPEENESIALNALESSDPDHALSSVLASWDMNNDGQFEIQPSLNKMIRYQYQDAGNYLIRLKLTDPSGAETISTPVSIKIPGALPPTENKGTGLRGEYFNNTSLTAPPVVNRIDPQVDFSWGIASPAAGINGDNFSVRWTGQVEAPVSGNYFFSTVSDDGVRLWINGAQVINNWVAHGVTTDNSAAVWLVRGTKYDVRMEFYERTGAAVARLLWSFPGQAQQAIPQSRLYPAGGEGICEGAGIIRQEFWTGVPGTRVSSIPTDTEPDFTHDLTIFEGPATNMADNYGSRIRGYICPPLSGRYIFWIAGDDQVELSLSTDDKPANKRRIAYHTGWTNRRQWTKYATQQSVPITLVADQRYYIEALMKEGSGADHVSVGWQLPSGVLQRPVQGEHLIPFEAEPPPPVCAGRGTILLETWTGVDGTRVSSIPVNTPPDLMGQRNIFEAPTNVGNNFGSRFRGYVCVPATGNYTFWIASDDHSELWLSTDSDPANKRRIAYHTGWTSPRQWTKYASQQSALISLVAGQQYYIEALYKEDEGGDNMAVGWQLPDAAFERPIPGGRLSPFQDAASAMATQTAIEDRLYSQINVYPNPARSADPELTISGYEGIDKTTETHIQITAMTGEVVFADRISCGGDCTSFLVKLEERLVPGIYMLHLQTNGYRSSRRLLVK